MRFWRGRFGRQNGRTRADGNSAEGGSTSQLPSQVRVLYVVTVPISAWIFLEGQLRYLRENGYSVRLISSPGPLLDQVSEREGIPVTGLAMERDVSVFKDLVSLWRLYRQIRLFKPHIVHMGTPKAALLAGLASWVCRVPVRIYTMHGLRLEGVGQPKRTVLTVLEWLTCRSVHEVLCVSPSLRRRAIEVGVVRPARTRVLGSGTANGISAQRFSPALRSLESLSAHAARLGMRAGAPTIGYAGRLTRDKGIAELCDAHRELRRDYPELQLLLVGWLDEADQLPEATREYVAHGDAVFCTDFVSDVSPYYGLMDIFALPTYREGFPTSPLEAAAAGIPVVTTKATGAMDSVVDGVTGILVDAGSAPQLTKALRRLLDDPSLRDAMGSRGRRRVESDFAQTQVWNALNVVYQRRLAVGRSVVRSPNAKQRHDVLPSGSSRPRVLMLIKSLGAGGAERLLVSQAAARSSQYEYQAAYLVPELDTLRGDLEATGVPVTCLKGASEWNPWWALRLRQLLAIERIDILHIHSPYVAALARLLVSTMPKTSRPAVVYTEHNLWGSYTRMTSWANRLTYGLNSASIAVSREVAQSITPRMRTGVVTIQHGVNVLETSSEGVQRDSVRETLGIRPEEVVIGIVANFRHEKAYDNLLAAATLVLDACPQARFVSVGHGPLRDEVHALAGGLGLGEKFLFLGYREDAVSVMSAFDIFVLSSIHEGLPVAMMEAMVLGLPVVATAVGGIPEAVTSEVEGILVQPSRPNSLAEALIRLTRDPVSRAEMGTASGIRGQTFDMRTATRRIEEVYQTSMVRS